MEDRSQNGNPELFGKLISGLRIYDEFTRWPCSLHDLGQSFLQFLMSDARSCREVDEKGNIWRGLRLENGIQSGGLEGRGSGPAPTVILCGPELENGTPSQNSHHGQSIRVRQVA